MHDHNFTHLCKPNTGDYYEGSQAFMRAIHPRPLISQVEILGDFNSSVVFREDSYDPTTRIRRGRFYQSVGAMQLGWDRVVFAPYPRPAAGYLADGIGAAHFQQAAQQTPELAKKLHTLQDYQIKIGQNPAQTEWRIIDREGLSDGGILYTLRSRSSFGLLPPLRHETDNNIAQAYQTVVDAGLRFDAVAIIDTCREACVRVLQSKYNIGAKDLSEIIKHMTNPSSSLSELQVVISAAKILARLHSRTKTSEQGRQAERGSPIRQISEDDGLLAIRLIGLVLQDLDYAAS